MFLCKVSQFSRCDFSSIHLDLPINFKRTYNTYTQHFHTHSHTNFLSLSLSHTHTLQSTKVKEYSHTIRELSLIDVLCQPRQKKGPLRNNRSRIKSNQLFQNKNTIFMKYDTQIFMLLKSKDNCVLFKLKNIKKNFNHPWLHINAIIVHFMAWI